MVEYINEESGYSVFLLTSNKKDVAINQRLIPKLAAKLEMNAEVIGSTIAGSAIMPSMVAFFPTPPEPGIPPDHG